MWGFGGGGKTTLAASIYMEIIRHFKSHCIIENIREESRKYGLKKLQGDILSALCKTKMEVYSVAEGKHKIKSSFLYDKDAKEWMCTMDRLRDIPESKIVDKLKISYDGLKPVEKELFLDVAYERFGMHDLIQEMGHIVECGNMQKSVTCVLEMQHYVENDQIEAIEFRHMIV
ncbi:Toll/interleukin-1 receptor domain-containing protein [Tanacetum coccineum]